MDYNSIESLKHEGFEGFEDVQKLMDYGCISVPKVRGVYFILNPTYEKKFMKINVGGHFKEKDPTVSVDELERNWVKDSIVLYMGKAGGPNSKATLQKRLKQYMRFGQGEPVGHWGGRLIWQLKNSHDLIVCWGKLPDGDPREVEKALIQDFTQTYGKRPFANLTG
jgi:hypothetical protein